MTDLSPPIAFEDFLLEGTRRMSRGARMNPELYHALKGEIQSLDNTAACMTLPEGTSPTTVRNWILHVAAVLGIPATVEKPPQACSSGAPVRRINRKRRRLPAGCSGRSTRGRPLPRGLPDSRQQTPVDHFGTVPTTPSTNQSMPSNISSTGFSPAAIRSLPG
jgi:hypothetical protein